MNFLRLIIFRWWVWAILPFLLCVTLKLNGSSIGVWQETLWEPGPPRGLLFFKPEFIRADEWHVVTPSMLSQARQSPPFPIVNESLGAGRTPLLMSVPVAYYTTLFRPQLWGFFLFDFERGFSFYWCCKIFGLLLGSAWLLRQLGIKSLAVLAFGTVWIFFSSFMQWWFSSPAMLPEMLASWAIMTGFALQFFSKLSRGRLVLALLGFVFFGTNFILCLYPGFQIPLLYISAAIFVGIWLQRRKTEDWQTKQGLLLLSAAIALLILGLVPLWLSLRQTLQIVAHTGYPGMFRSHGGGLSLFKLFSGVFGFFETESRVPFGYDNICEASNFYPLWVVVLFALGTAKWLKQIRIAPLLVTLTVVIGFFSFYCLMPLPGLLARGTLLGLTTENRLLLGIGIGNILLSCVFLDLYRTAIPARVGITCIAIALLGLATVAWTIHAHVDKTRLIYLAIINALIIGLFFWEQARPWFLGVFAALLIVNGVAINPVMRGLSPLLDSNAFQKIDKLRVADPTARWIVYEHVSFAQLVKATGASVFNGTKVVPDLDLLYQLDPEKRYDDIYNRYATIVVYLPVSLWQITFHLVVNDLYQVILPPDLPLLAESGYRYLVFPRPWLNASLHGYSLAEEIEPTHLYIYRRNTDQQ